MKAKKLVAVGLAAVMATASMGTTAFADGLELEAHPDLYGNILIWIFILDRVLERFPGCGKNARSRSQIWRNNRIRR